MRASLIAAAALLCGSAVAQPAPAQDGGAMCRSFCDADANKCRRDAQFDASVEADPLVDFHGPRADKDDFSAQKYQQAVRSADKDRFAQSQKCSEARMVCRQKCSVPAATAASTAH